MVVEIRAGVLFGIRCGQRATGRAKKAQALGVFG